MNYPIPMMLDVRSSNHFEGVKEALFELSASEVYWDITCHCADVELNMSRFILGLVFPTIGDHVVAFLPDYTSEEILAMAKDSISNIKAKERQRPVFIQPRNNFSRSSVRSIGAAGVRDNRQLFSQVIHPPDKPDGDVGFELEDPLRADSPVPVDPTDIMEVIADDEGDGYVDEPVLVDFPGDPELPDPLYYPNLVQQERNQQQNLIMQQKMYLGHSGQRFRPPITIRQQNDNHVGQTSASKGNILQASDSNSDERGSSFIYKSGQQFIRFYSSPSNGKTVSQEEKECDIQFLRNKYKNDIKKCDVVIARLKPSKQLDDDLERYRIQKYLHKRASALQPRKKTRCQRCHNCNVPDCMVCVHCQDMKKYGGPQRLKKGCKTRPKCELLI